MEFTEYGGYIKSRKVFVSLRVCTVGPTLPASVCVVQCSVVSCVQQPGVSSTPGTLGSSVVREFPVDRHSDSETVRH